jgi:hypothetical protein
MNKKIIWIVASLFLVSGLLGASWHVANAQGTIPPVIPPVTPPGEDIPVTGGTTQSIVIPSVCKDVVIEIEYVARVIFVDCPKAGSTANMVVLKSEDIQLLKPLTYLGEVFQVTTDNSYKGKMIVGAYLSDAQKATMLKDPDYGLYKYDMIKAEWTRLTATLDGNYYSAETDVPGIFALGKEKK